MTRSQAGRSSQGVTLGPHPGTSQQGLQQEGYSRNGLMVPYFVPCSRGRESQAHPHSAGTQLSLGRAAGAHTGRTSGPAGCVLLRQAPAQAAWLFQASSIWTPDPSGWHRHQGKLPSQGSLLHLGLASHYSFCSFCAWALPCPSHSNPATSDPTALSLPCGRQDDQTLSNSPHVSREARLMVGGQARLEAGLQRQEFNSSLTHSMTT